MATRQTAAEYSAAVVEAFEQWLENRAYIDGQGNYHVKEPYERRRIAPWNKEVKRAFKTVSVFHDAAHAFQEAGGTSDRGRIWQQ